MPDIIPQFEPEVIIAKKQRACSPDRISTTAITEYIVDDVTITSRYRQAHEFERMAAAIRLVPFKLRAAIQSIDCDSKQGSSYSVTLRPGNRHQAETLGCCIGAAIYEVAGLHWDIVISDRFGDILDVEPNFGDVEPKFGD